MVQVIDVSQQAVVQHTIWKAQLEIHEEQEIEVPTGAVFLTAREQNNRPTVWYICDPNPRAWEMRKVFIVGTGHRIPVQAQFYLGTCSCDDGHLIWHVFLDRRG